MNKALGIGILFIVILFITGFYYGFNSIPESLCFGAGQPIDFKSMEDLLDEKCCPGLSIIVGCLGDDGKCGSICAGDLICSDCGNGICESWENKCTCEVDCDPDYEPTNHTGIISANECNDDYISYAQDSWYSIGTMHAYDEIVGYAMNLLLSIEDEIFLCNNTFSRRIKVFENADTSEEELLIEDNMEFNERGFGRIEYLNTDNPPQGKMKFQVLSEDGRIILEVTDDRLPDIN